MAYTQEQKEAAAEARRRYQKQWRKDNKDKVRKYNENFWIRKAEGARASNNGERGESA